MAIVLSFTIVNPSAFSNKAGHPFANKSMYKVFLTGIILLFAKPVSLTRASNDLVLLS